MRYYALVKLLVKNVVGVAAGVEAGLALQLGTGLSFVVVSHDTPAEVTAAHIRQVQPGMSVVQVAGLLGRPYTLISTKGSGHHTPGCANPDEGTYVSPVSDTLNIVAWVRRATADSARHSCDMQESLTNLRHTTFLYSRPVPGAGSYAMLWVKFDSAARVASTYAFVYNPWLFREEDDIEESAEKVYSPSAPADSAYNLDRLAFEFN